jgi:hypothetical protein
MAEAANPHAAAHQLPQRPLEHSNRTRSRTRWAQYLRQLAATQPPPAPAVLRQPTPQICGP